MSQSAFDSSRRGLERWIPLVGVCGSAIFVCAVLFMLESPLALWMRATTGEEYNSGHQRTLHDAPVVSVTSPDIWIAFSFDLDSFNVDNGNSNNLCCSGSRRNATVSR